MLQQTSTPSRVLTTRTMCTTHSHAAPTPARLNAQLYRSGTAHPFELNPRRLGAALLRHYAEIQSLPLPELNPPFDVDAAAMYVLRSWPAWLRLLKPRGLKIDLRGRRYWRVPSAAEAALRANALYLVARDSLTQAASLLAAETLCTQAAILLNTSYEDLRQLSLKQRRALPFDPCPLALCEVTPTTQAVSLHATSGSAAPDNCRPATGVAT